MQVTNVLNHKKNQYCKTVQKTRFCKITKLCSQLSQNCENWWVTLLPLNYSIEDRQLILLSQVELKGENPVISHKVNGWQRQWYDLQECIRVLFYIYWKHAALTCTKCTMTDAPCPPSWFSTTEGQTREQFFCLKVCDALIKFGTIGVLHQYPVSLRPKHNVFLKSFLCCQFFIYIMKVEVPWLQHSRDMLLGSTNHGGKSNGRNSCILLFCLSLLEWEFLPAATSYGHWNL